MKLPYSEPDPAGSERARKAKDLRDLATEVSRLHPQALTRSNGEEADHGPRNDADGNPIGARYPANFTKGLEHDECGLVAEVEDYRCLVEAINAPDPTLFEKHVVGAGDTDLEYHCTIETTDKKTGKKKRKSPNWRGWESPRAGHVYELEGPDPGAVGMAPAPRVGSSELAAEMAEVYGLALLRDVPFTTIAKGGSKKLCPADKKTEHAALSAADVVHVLNDMPFYSGKKVRSSTPHTTGADGLNGFERNRRSARLQGQALTEKTVFRGSTKGAMVGPYISQFMLIGGDSLNCEVGGAGQSNFPGTHSAFDFRDGFVPYGSITIDQRTLTHKNCLDYMTDWCSWLDVQNGANLKGADVFEPKRRFITTPRDLATYVHFDALYEAYLNACLILLGRGTPASKGFPEPSPSMRRDAFATFGGPHILSLVCEVATRCLKAVRRQKFNYHRRARPETLGGRFSLLEMGIGDELGCTERDFADSLDEIPAKLKHAIIKHNHEQNKVAMQRMRNVKCKGSCLPKNVSSKKFHEHGNLLLPMAFPEGSPMHPAYGAGHATVAGGCVTMLKAFFEMFEDCDSRRERKLYDADNVAYVPNDDGSRLKKDTHFKGSLTIQGELDKLAANVSIGRNMAGVHYYSDYYDSLRMGERIAIGILMEQAPTYGDAMETSLKSFDGDLLTLSGEAGSCPTMSITGRDGGAVSPNSWWLRHVSGQEFSEDL